MNQRIGFVFLGCSILTALMSAQDIRRPVWAGQFYDARPDALSRQLDDLLNWVKLPGGRVEVPLALIAPHAGYVYSGAVAAHAYRLVRGQDIATVVIIGVSHRYGFPGASIYPRGGYATPLGTAEIDAPLAASISEASGFGFVPAAHLKEHSIEVQVPFIQKVLPGARIVPVLMGRPTEGDLKRLSEALTKTLPGKKTLVVVSTDLSHYLSKAEANARDAETIALLQAGEADSLYRKLVQQDNRLCGGSGAAAALLYAAHFGKPRVEVLKYADSSDAGGPDSNVVGYLAAAVFAATPDEPTELSPSSRKELLGLARASVELLVRENRILEPRSQNRELDAPRGAFVTLKKRGLLRGCIGFVEPAGPLSKAVIMAAVYAASRDVRFKPVEAAELKDLEYEISVLSPPQRIQDPERIEVGRHGLIISRGDRRGLLLPQVPVENHWDRNTFLAQACLKAGLPEDAWQKGAAIYVFEALVFHESP